jgi:uncharacterized protein YlzI (FlbEa/FlbD family)
MSPLRLVKLTRWDGTPFWLNPARVLHVESARRHPGDGADVVFDSAGNYERVKECPRTVAGLLLDPLR